MDDLRMMQHKDADGNPISKSLSRHPVQEWGLTTNAADPDRSNPTRNRMERPLDTIRAFNAAAEGTTSRRSSLNNRPPSQVGWNNDINRRGSYYSSEQIHMLHAGSCY